MDIVGFHYIADALPRDRLAKRLFNLTSEMRVVHISAPPLTGKTCLIQLLEILCAMQGIIFIYITQYGNDAMEALKHIFEMSPDGWTVKPYGQCSDPSLRFVVALEGIQHFYAANVGLWTGLNNTAVKCTLPPNVSIVVATTYSMSDKEYPVALACMPHLTMKDFLLSDTDIETGMDIFNSRQTQHKVIEILRDPLVRRIIAAYCNGHAGCLRYYKVPDPEVSVRNIVIFYLSSTMFPYFFPSFTKMRSLSAAIRILLVKSLVGQTVYYALPDDKDFVVLLREGLIAKMDRGEVKITSPVAAAYLNELIFPYRSHDSINMIAELGIFALVKAVLTNMFASEVCCALGPKSSDLSGASDVTTFQAHATSFTCSDSL